MLHEVENDLNDTKLNEAVFLRIAKLYLFTGVVCKIGKYVDKAMKMLDSKHEVIPNVLIFEVNHSIQDHLLISGYFWTVQRISVMMFGLELLTGLRLNISNQRYHIMLGSQQGFIM